MPTIGERHAFLRDDLLDSVSRFVGRHHGCAALTPFGWTFTGQGEAYGGRRRGSCDHGRIQLGRLRIDYRTSEPPVTRPCQQGWGSWGFQTRFTIPMGPPYFFPMQLFRV